MDAGDDLDVRDVVSAARRIGGLIVQTPVLHSDVLDRVAGTEIWLKAENLQATGSFKARGAVNALSRLTNEQLSRGVVAQSTGNHAAGVAYAAQLLGTTATVVLPEDAPANKVFGARRLGAEVILAGTTLEERHRVVSEQAHATGATVIDAYDHPDVVAGQGTATLELLEQVELSTGRPLEAVIVPVGGGGGVAGACLACEPAGIPVYGVEPWGCDPLAQSLSAGRPVIVSPTETLADGLKSSRIGSLPWAVTSARLTGSLHVTDKELATALVSALIHVKLLLEPSGAAGLAAAIRGDLPDHPARVGVVLTGGNVDLDLVVNLINNGAIRPVSAGSHEAQTKEASVA